MKSRRPTVPAWLDGGTCRSSERAKAIARAVLIWRRSGALLELLHLQIQIAIR